MSSHELAYLLAAGAGGRLSCTYATRNLYFLTGVKKDAIRSLVIDTGIIKILDLARLVHDKDPCVDLLEKRYLA